MSESNDTTVTFRGVEGESNAHLSDYLFDLLGTTLDSFLPAEPYHLDLKVNHSNLHNNHNNQRFECEAVVRIEGERSPIVVKKTNENFYSAATACEAVLRKMLTRRTRVRAQARRQPRPMPIPESA